MLSVGHIPMYTNINKATVILYVRPFSSEAKAEVAPNPASEYHSLTIEGGGKDQPDSTPATKK
jgi:hypothetical protein